MYLTELTRMMLLSSLVFSTKDHQQSSNPLLTTWKSWTTWKLLIFRISLIILQGAICNLVLIKYFNIGQTQTMLFGIKLFLSFIVPLAVERVFKQILYLGLILRWKFMIYVIFSSIRWPSGSRTPIFSTLNHSSSHRCGFEPSSGHMWDKPSSTCR